MSLVGNLEDLGLGDILQIVSLSRKSGVLSLQGRDREGRVYFQGGQVVRAVSSTWGENLGDLLLRKELVNRDTLRRALVEQKKRKTSASLKTVLAEVFGTDAEAVEEVAREQVERIVCSFFGWTEGAFDFELCEPGSLGRSGDPLDIFLEQGISPQWLAMEGSRILDEKRHRGESGAEETRSESTVDLQRLLGSDGDGPPAETAVAAHAPSPQAGENPLTTNSLYDFGAELLRELGEDNTAFHSGKDSESPGLYLLRGMLEELNNPSLGGGIILLVLRFASELMNRAVFFLVKEVEIIGLGQFGIEFSGEMGDVRVRRMRIRRDEGSVFSSALKEMRAHKTRLGQSRWDVYLQEQLGGGEPEEIFLGPIVSEGKVVALIYGDNLPEQKPIGNTESLEIFLSQAGLAMEKALLERRLRDREAI